MMISPARVLVALSLFAFATTATAQTFERIADTQTAVPGGSGDFTLFADARALENGRVAFVGYDSNSDVGIYTFRNSTLAKLVDEQTAVPGTPDTFSDYFDVSLDGGLVAFTGGWPGPGGGCSFSGSEGVFGMKFTGGGIAAVATSLSTTRNCFHGVDFEHRVIGVAGGVNPVDVFHNHTESIMASKRVGQLITAYDTTTPLPGGGSFVGYDQDFRIRQGGILLMEIIPNTTGAVAGLYADQRDGQGPQLVANATTAIPNGGGNFQNFASADWDGTTVAFIGRNAGNATALYKGSAPGNLQFVAGAGTPVPGQGVNLLGLSNPCAFDGTRIAFSGYWGGGGAGLFIEEAGAISALLVKGDALDGRTVDQAFVRPGHLNGGQALIDVRFQGGDRGLYLATL